jgi:hypothetical protein
MLDEQSGTYATGQLREERDAERIQALCKLGRLDEMESARVRFLAEHPRSPHESRVRGVCPAAPRK